MVTAQSLGRGLSAPETDQRILMHHMSWWQFEAMLAARGDNATPRMAFLGGTIELISPSRQHEIRKSLLGRLVEAYAFERGIRFYPWASTTLKGPGHDRGAEPDEAYGFDAHGTVPDLVIEAVLTSGGLDKLEVYRGLGVREVWFAFDRGPGDRALEAHQLIDGAYVPITESSVLPGLSIADLRDYAARDDVYDAVLAFRAALAARTPRP